MNQGIFGLPQPRSVPGTLSTIWIPGGYYGPLRTGNLSTSAATSNRMYFHPLFLGPGVYDALATQIFGTSTGNLRMSIWDARRDNWPGRRIATTGDISNGSTGIKDGIIPRVEISEPTLFWVGLVSQGGTPTLLSSSSNVVNGQMPARASRCLTSGNIYDMVVSLYLDGITGDMPAQMPEPSTSIAASLTLTQVYARAAIWQ